MKDLGATLKYLDHQIDTKRQQIAVLTLQVAEIENSRKTILALVDDDQTREEEQQAIRMNGVSHAKPLLIVRKEGAGEIQPGSVSEAEPPKKKKRKSPKYVGDWERYSERRSPLRHKLWTWFQAHPDQQITSGSLVGELGLQAEAQQVINALLAMRSNGDLVKDDEGRYSLKGKKKTGVPQGTVIPRRNPVSMRERIRTFLGTRTEPMFAREILAGMHIETGSADYKLFGQSISTMKTAGQVEAIGNKPPFQYLLRK